MQLYFIRHGQSENNALWDKTGDNSGRKQDPALTEIGALQAQTLADFLKNAGPGADPANWDPQNRLGFGFTHLYCSLMVRAVETGELIARTLGLQLAAWIDWHEEGGIYLDDEETGKPIGLPGKDREYFSVNYASLILPDDFGAGGWWNRPFEDQPDRSQRARRVLIELWQRHGNSNDRVAVISHGGFFNYFLAALFNQSRLDDHTQPEQIRIPGFSPGRWFLLNNSSISRIDFTSEEIRFVYQNRLDFLPNELIT